MKNISNNTENIKTLVIKINHPLAKLLRSKDFEDIAYKILEQEFGLIGLVLNNYKITKFKRNFDEYSTAELEQIKLNKIKKKI